MVKKVTEKLDSPSDSSTKSKIIEKRFLISGRDQNFDKEDEKISPNDHGSYQDRNKKVKQEELQFKNEEDEKLYREAV